MRSDSTSADDDHGALYNFGGQGAALSGSLNPGARGDEPIEWSPITSAINNFVRAILEGEAVSCQSLAYIATVPATETNRILADVYRALFVDRDAPILASKTWLGELICAGPVSIRHCDLRVALQIALSDFGRPILSEGSDTLSVIANSGLALGIAALTATSEGAYRGSIWQAEMSSRPDAALR